MLSRTFILAAASVVVGIVLVSALPAPAYNEEPECASATATPEEIGPSATPDDVARGYVCRENGEVVGRALAGD